jgi:2-polyprenyl-6-methoxyphenol hydroxylase-like FAD-dependent oxidoreductase
MNITPTNKKALIIGGGIAGPVTAMALQRAGIEALVCEAYDAPFQNTRGCSSTPPPMAWTCLAPSTSTYRPGLTWLRTQAKR